MGLKGRVVAAAFALLLGMVAAWGQGDQGLITLDRGRFQVEGGAAQTVSLPHRLYRGTREHEPFRLEIDFLFQPA